MEKLTEIRDFTIIYDGLFWIYYQEKYCPISIKPAELEMLFEKEGIDMKTPDEDDGFSVSYNFKKTVLMISSSYFLQLKDELNQDVSPVLCTIKLKNNNLSFA
jgi:hypothetical protein